MLQSSVLEIIQKVTVSYTGMYFQIHHHCTHTHNRHTPVCHRTTIWKNVRFKTNLHAHISSSILYTVPKHSNNVLLSSATVHTTTHILHTPFAHYSTHCCATTCGFRTPKFPISQNSINRTYFLFCIERSTPKVLKLLLPLRRYQNSL